MKRITIFAIWLVVGLLLSGCMTTISKRQPMTARTTTALSASIPATMPPVEPLATAAPLPPRPAMHMPHTALHGRPPFETTLTAELNADLSRQLAGCLQLIWDFGDGRRLSQPCPPPSESYTPITAVHQYSQPETYFVRVQMEMADGRVIESDKTQTVIVAEAQPVSWSGRLFYWLVWLGAMALAAAAAIWLARRPRWPAVWGGALLFLALTAYLPPFSYLPDPLGLYWGLFGGHRYDPRLPFANRFVTRDDPTEMLRPYLDGLRGQTGLDPLDPVHPLTHYEFIQVKSGGLYYRQFQMTAVATRLTYANNEQRVYDIPVFQTRSAFYQGNWHYDGLERLRTEHTAVPGIPFATEDAWPLTHAVAPGAERILSANTWLAHWRLLQPDLPGASAPILWSPQGDSFLILRWEWGDRRSLWQVTLDGRPPQRLAANVDQYGWSADGQAVLYTTMDFFQTGDGLLAQDLYRVGLDGRNPETVLRLPGGHAWPDIRPDGIYFVANGMLLRHDNRQQVTTGNLPLPGAANENRQLSNDQLVRFNPAGDRLAYSCQQRREEARYNVHDLCLLDKDGQNWVHIPLATAQMKLSWRPDGVQLAVVQWAYHHDPYVWKVENGEPVLLTQIGTRPHSGVVLTIVDRDGRILRTISISEEGEAQPAQWLAGGRHLLLQLYIWGGRRIILVDTETGALTDLSRPRWDAEFSLHPEGRQLLLSNGRGLFWLTEIGDAD